MNKHNVHINYFAIIRIRFFRMLAVRCYLNWYQRCKLHTSNLNNKFNLWINKWNIISIVDFFPQPAPSVVSPLLNICHQSSPLLSVWHNVELNPFLSLCHQSNWWPDKMVLDKMARTKWDGQNGMDKMLATFIDSNSIE